MGSYFSSTPVLQDEEKAELTMVSGLTVAEIQDFRKKFFAASGGNPTLTRDMFLDMPEVKENPLRERLAVVMGLDAKASSIDFKQFVTCAGVFSPSATGDQKARAVFKMYDVDNDGSVSRADLLVVLDLTTEFATLDPAEKAKTLASIVDRVMNESSSHPKKTMLSFDDFSTVFITIDGAEPRLNIPFR